MEERNTYDKQYEIIISFNKIWDNLIRYWWICIICFFAAVLAVFGLSYRSYQSGRTALQNEVDLYKEDFDTMVENEEDKLQYVYIAKSVVYMARDNVDLNSLITDSIIPEDANLYERSDYIEIYKEYMTAWIESSNISTDKSLLYDCLELMYTDIVTDEINEKLIAAGYDKYDRYYDNISMTLGNNARFYTLSLAGEDPERIEFIIKTAADILIEKSRDILGIEYSRIVDEASTKEYIQWEEERLLSSDKIVEELTEELQITVDERTKIYTDALSNLNNYSFSISHLISVKNILVLFVGIFMGLGIIFVLILLDKKVRNKDEAELYFEYPVLGDVNEMIKEDSQYSVLAAALDYKCSSQGIKSILITGSQNGDKSKAFADKLAEELGKMGKACTLIDINSMDSNIETKLESAKKKDGLLIVNAMDINKSAAAIQAAGNVDTIIFTICADNESIPMIQKGINNIKIVGGNILGCILIKKSKVFK